MTSPQVPSHPHWMLHIPRPFRDCLAFILALVVYHYYAKFESDISSIKRLHVPKSSELMGSETLINWVKDHLAPLYERNPEGQQIDTDGLLQSTFTADPKILYNHESITLAKFKEDLAAAATAVTRANIEWKEVFDIPRDNEEGNAVATGIVTGYYIVNRYMKFRIRVGPAQRIQQNFFSVKVENIQETEGDRRRISEMYITSVVRQAPIHLQGVTQGSS